MKKMKRLVAVLLAGVMALTMLTACGGGGGGGSTPTNSITRNIQIEEQLEDKLKNSLSTNPNATIQLLENANINTIIESYAKGISVTPSEYLKSCTDFWELNSFSSENMIPVPPYSDLFQNVLSACNSAIHTDEQSAAKIAICVPLIIDGTIAEDEIITNLNSLDDIIFNDQSMSGVTSIEYCAHVYKCSNGNDSVWSIFITLVMM